MFECNIFYIILMLLKINKKDCMFLWFPTWCRSWNKKTILNIYFVWIICCRLMKHHKNFMVIPQHTCTSFSSLWTMNHAYAFGRYNIWKSNLRMFQQRISVHVQWHVHTCKRVTLNPISKSTTCMLKLKIHSFRH